MKKPGASQGQWHQSSSHKESPNSGTGAEDPSRMRKLIKAADPEVAEEWKWVNQRHPARRSGRTTASSAPASPIRMW